MTNEQAEKVVNLLFYFTEQVEDSLLWQKLVWATHPLFRNAPPLDLYQDMLRFSRTYSHYPVEDGTWIDIKYTFIKHLQTLSFFQRIKAFGVAIYRLYTIKLKLNTYRNQTAEKNNG